MAKSSGSRPALVRPAGRVRWVLAQAPFLIVVAIVMVAIVLLANDRWRRAAFVLGGAAEIAAVMRIALPASKVGLLQVRGRIFDASFLAVLGGLVLWLATSIDPLGTD